MSRLRGSFVVAIVDGALGRAMLARDPMGSHPLFYAEAGSCVLFAVSPGRLLGRLVYHASSIAPRLPITSVIAGRIRTRRFSRRSAACRRECEPCSRRAACNSMATGIPRRRSALQWLTAEEVSGFDDAFERAVKRCLCHGRTGIFLSGGPHSISVAAVAADCARASGQSLPTCVVTRISGTRMQRARASGGRCTGSRPSPDPYRF